MPTSPDPLVVEASPSFAGALCTRILVQAGFRVVRVRPRGTDPLESLGRLTASAVTAGKEEVALDLTDERDQEGFRALLADARVVVEGYRPATARRLGADPDSVWHASPDALVVSLRNYPPGSRADRPAHDINLMAASGAADLCRDADGTPVYWGLQVSVFATALTAAVSVLAVLRGDPPFRRHITIDMYSVLASWLLPRALLATELESPTRLLQSMAPPLHAFFETSDGRHVSLGVRDEGSAARVASALAAPAAERVAVAEAIAALATEEVEARLSRDGVPFAVVEPVERLLHDVPPGVFGDLYRDGAWNLGIGGLDAWASPEGQ